MNKALDSQDVRLAKVRASARRSSIERHAWGLAEGLLSGIFYMGMEVFQLAAVASVLFAGAAMIPSPVQALARAIPDDFVEHAIWCVMILGGIVAFSGIVNLILAPILDRRWAEARADRQSLGDASTSKTA